MYLAWYIRQQTIFHTNSTSVVRIKQSPGSQRFGIHPE